MFAQRIKILRTTKRISQDKLGQILGVTQQAVAKWEAGASEPDTETLLKLSALFQVSVDYLLCNASVTPGHPIYDPRILNLPPDKKRILDTVLQELECSNGEEADVGKRRCPAWISGKD